MVRIKRIFNKIRGKSAQSVSYTGEPTILPRAQHPITRKLISPQALKVLYRLQGAGFEAYLVGGSVRDLMLGREPKDFDVATNAKPEEVKKIFKNCRLIGKRFRLAHIFYKDEIIEVATFRSDDTNSKQNTETSRQGMLIRDNVYGKLDDDVWRRDFTINALYYNIADFSVVDYVDGVPDIEHGLIRMIGDPKARYREDPVRILRAVRFAAKLGFRIHEDTEAPIAKMRKLLEHVPQARLFDEALKLFLGGAAVNTYALLRHHKLLEYFFPTTEACLSNPTWHQSTETLILQTLKNTDDRVQNNQSVTPAFLIAAMLWFPVQLQAKELQERQPGLKFYQAFRRAVDEVLHKQTKHIVMPRRFSLMTREIWFLQSQFQRRGSKRPFRLLRNPRFRAAYDFLLLRAESCDPKLQSLASWWTEFHDCGEDRRHEMIEELSHPKPKKSQYKKRK